MTEAYHGLQVVGMDLHRQRSVIVRMTEDGRKLETVRITNSPAALRAELAQAAKHPRWSSRPRRAGTGPWTCSRRRGPRCTWHTRWASRPSATGGLRTMNGTPRTWRTCCGWAGCRKRGSPRRRSASCARSPGTGTSWSRRAPRSRTRCTGCWPSSASRSPTDIFGVHGQTWLDGLELPQPYAGKVASLRQLARGLTAEIALLDQVLADLPAGHEDTPRSSPCRASARCWPRSSWPRSATSAGSPGPGSWAAGRATPRHYESDTKVIRGHVTKQGSRTLRWAVVEAIQRQPAGTRPRQVKDDIIARRGKEAKNIAKVAAARELLTLVFYAMRDGDVRRALQRGQAA